MSEKAGYPRTGAERSRPQAKTSANGRSDPDFASLHPGYGSSLVIRRADGLIPDFASLHPGYGQRRAPSAHAELLLQAGRGSGVLEHQLLVREHVVIGPLRHQRRLVEAAQDELDFPRIPIDVADGENPGLVGLEACGVDRNELALTQVDTPLRHRPELHGEPEERQHGFAGERHTRSVGALDQSARERAAAALERRDLPEQEIDLSLLDERMHLVDAVGRRAERVAPMQ